MTDDRERYRIYRRFPGHALQLVCTTDSEEGVGVAICTLAREGEFAEAMIGVLDSEGGTGERWLVKPFVKGGR